MDDWLDDAIRALRAGDELRRTLSQGSPDRTRVEAGMASINDEIVRLLERADGGRSEQHPRGSCGVAEDAAGHPARSAVSARSWTCPEPGRPARSDQRLQRARRASRRGTIRASAQAIPAPRSSQRNVRGRIGLEGPGDRPRTPISGPGCLLAGAPGPDRFLLRDDGTNRSASLSESFLAEKSLPVQLTAGCSPPARPDPRGCRSDRVTAAETGHVALGAVAVAHG